MNYTEAYTTYGVKVIVSPDVPNNEGAFRVLRITAPEGSILNARYPGPVAARHVVGHFLPHTVARPVGVRSYITTWSSYEHLPRPTMSDRKP